MPSRRGILTSMITRSGLSALGQVDGLLAVAGLADDLVALLAQHLGQIHPDERLVLGDEHAVRFVRRPSVTRSCAHCPWRSRRPGMSGPLGASSMVGGRAPPYPNWQRKRIQNPSSVSSNLTEGTSSALPVAAAPTGRCQRGERRPVGNDAAHRLPEQPHRVGVPAGAIRVAVALAVPAVARRRQHSGRVARAPRWRKREIRIGSSRSRTCPRET